MSEEVFDEEIARLHAFIEDSGVKARVVVSQAPVTYSMKASSELFTEGWRTGFGRCLAELKRIADKEKDND